MLLNVEEFININKNIQSDNEQSDCELPPRILFRAILPPISHFLLQFNSSTNFFVYCIFDKKIRRIIKEKYIWFYNLLREPILSCFATNSNGNNGTNSIDDNLIY